ncbi:MAG: hypothetical protein WDA27_02650 [Actinomycetota bacterium]
MTRSNVVALGVPAGIAAVGSRSLDGGVFPSLPSQEFVAASAWDPTIRDESVVRAAAALRAAAAVLARRWEKLTPDRRLRALALLESAAARMEEAVTGEAGLSDPLTRGLRAADKGDVDMPVEEMGP